MSDSYRATVLDTGNRIFRWEVDVEHGTGHIEGNYRKYILRFRAERAARRWADQGKKVRPFAVASYES